MERRVVNLPAAQFLPHTPPMLWVRTLVEVAEDSAVCEAKVDDAFLPFAAESGAIDAYFLVEIMAQSVGVWAGYWGKQRGAERLAGMLLACRAFKAQDCEIPFGVSLRIVVKKIMQDENTGSFEASAFIAELSGVEPFASASLTTYKTAQDNFGQVIAKSRA